MENAFNEFEDLGFELESIELEPTPSEKYYASVLEDCERDGHIPPSYDLVKNNLDESAKKEGFNNFDELYNHNVAKSKESSEL